MATHEVLTVLSLSIRLASFQQEASWDESLGCDRILLGQIWKGPCLTNKPTVGATTPSVVLKEKCRAFATTLVLFK